MAIHSQPGEQRKQNIYDIPVLHLPYKINQ